jgi:phosphoserine aminotransferase
MNIKTPGSSTDTINKLKKYGLVVGKGYGKYKEEYIRISNFPSHTLKDVKKLIQYLS